MDLRQVDVYQLQPELRRLKEELEQMSREQQIPFGLGCCERLHPTYASIVAKESAPDVLRPIIDQLWDHLEGNPKSIEDLAALRKLAESARETLNDTTPEQEYVAVYNCMDATYLTSAACLENTVDYVVRAWMCCEDVVYQLLRDRLLEGFVGLVEPERSRELQAVIRVDPLIVR